MMIKHFGSPYLGHSLADYACGIVLITCVAVGGLQLLGDNLNGLLGGVANPVKGYQDSVLGPAQAQVASGAKAPKTASVDNNPSAPLMGAPLDAANAENASLLQQVQPYNPNQVSGSNGVELVKGYSDKIRAVIQALDADPNADPQLRTMLTDLANAGHYVADQLPYYISYADSLGIAGQQDRYQQRKTQTLNYLSQNPQVLSAELTEVVRMAANNTTAVLSDLGNNTDFSTQIHESGNTICNSGGDTAKCVR